ncbi:MotE family protein [Inquilinus sp. NPDC058860]|uniref:MotE family protein n=1 Tax=Inquilinus sp. NPDC058860 TaxID=3346652 RepID=UPI0036748D1F
MRALAAIAVVAALGVPLGVVAARGQDAPASPSAQPAAEPIPSELLAAIEAERGELEARRARLDEREALLAVAEARVRHEVDRLAVLKREIEGQLAQQSGLLEADLKRMGATYAAMRARDAARIMDEMEPATVVSIFDRMPERRSAPILGAMTPLKAQEVTRLILERHQVPPS